MDNHFTQTIDGREAWGRVFTDVDAFTPLVYAIYEAAGMPRPPRVEGMTPGTNAVFRCGDTVVKIFAPEPSGFYAERDRMVEAAMLTFAKQVGVDSCALLAAGEFQDRYVFWYMIMDYVEGEEAGDVLASYLPSQRRDFARGMREACERLNRPSPGLLPPLDVSGRAVTNPGLERLPARLAEDLRDRAGRQHGMREVVVHGDMTGENILIRPDGTPVLIDFADSVLAPACYELAALVFELFRCDGGMVRAFAGDVTMDAFLQRLLDGLSLHAFCPELILTYAGREGIESKALGSLAALEDRLRGAWKAAWA